MTKIDNNEIAVSNAVNTLMTRVIEVDVKKFKITQWKSKQPNLEVLNYIKGGKYLDIEVGKYIYAVR